jgi:hypothetical protein
MRKARPSPLSYAGNACAGTLPWNTNLRGKPTRQEPNT